MSEILKRVSERKEFGCYKYFSLDNVYSQRLREMNQRIKSTGSIDSELFERADSDVTKYPRIVNSESSFIIGSVPSHKTVESGCSFNSSFSNYTHDPGSATLEWVDCVCSVNINKSADCITQSANCQYLEMASSNRTKMSVKKNGCNIKPVTVNMKTQTDNSFLSICVDSLVEVKEFETNTYADETEMNAFILKLENAFSQPYENIADFIPAEVVSQGRLNRFSGWCIDMSTDQDLGRLLSIVREFEDGVPRYINLDDGDKKKLMKSIDPRCVAFACCDNEVNSDEFLLAYNLGLPVVVYEGEDTFAVHRLNCMTAVIKTSTTIGLEFLISPLNLLHVNYLDLVTKYGKIAAGMVDDSIYAKLKNNVKTEIKVEMVSEATNCSNGLREKDLQYINQNSFNPKNACYPAIFQHCRSAPLGVLLMQAITFSDLDNLVWRESLVSRMEFEKSNGSLRERSTAMWINACKLMGIDCNVDDNIEFQSGPVHAHFDENVKVMDFEPFVRDSFRFLPNEKRHSTQCLSHMKHTHTCKCCDEEYFCGVLSGSSEKYFKCSRCYRKESELLDEAAGLSMSVTPTNESSEFKLVSRRRSNRNKVRINHGTSKNSSKARSKDIKVNENYVEQRKLDEIKNEVVPLESDNKPEVKLHETSTRSWAEIMNMNDVSNSKKDFKKNFPPLFTPVKVESLSIQDYQAIYIGDDTDFNKRTVLLRKFHSSVFGPQSEYSSEDFTLGLLRLSSKNRAIKIDILKAMENYLCSRNSTTLGIIGAVFNRLQNRL